MSNRTLIVGGVVVLLVVCACALAVLAAAGGAFLMVRAGAATPAPTLNPTQVSEAIQNIQAFVIATRGLQPEAPVELTYLTVEQTRQRVLDDFEEDYSPEEAADDARVLEAFGLIAPGLDLYDLYVRLYSEGVAGFYDPDTEELVLVSDSQGFDAYERVVFAHEYTHALQDQVFDLRASGFSEEMWDTDPQRAAAIQAVLEGDASLLEEQYLDTFSRDERRQYDAIVNDVDISIYFELPQFLLLDFIFPYDQGLEFVRHYYEAGGWPGVDAVWQNPPVSTEHILHPERYDAGDLPVAVARPPLTSTLGSGWRLIDTGVNGEWYTYLLLRYAHAGGARLGNSTAERAAEGWGGDGYSAYYNDDTGGLVLAAHWVWDTEDDASEFAEALRDYGEGRWGTPQDDTSEQVCWLAGGLTCFLFRPNASLWLQAPDPATLELVLAEYPDF